MKKITLILSAVALVLGINACQKAEFDQPLDTPQIEENLVRVTLTAGNATKTSLANNGDVLWSSNDAIAVAAATSGNIYKFDLSAGAGTISATFTGLVRPSDVEDLAYASYPYADNLSVVEGVITGFAIPSNQEYVAGTFADNVNPMVGNINEGAIAFVNTAALAKIRLFSGVPVAKAELGQYKMEFNNLDASQGVDLIFVVAAGNYSSDIDFKVNDVKVNAFSGKSAVAGKRFDFGTYYTNTCKIGDTVYNTLAEAVTAVPTGTETTILMISNEVIVGNAGVIIPAGKSIILNTNGKTIENFVTANAGSQVIDNKGTLTLTGGGIIKNGTAEATIAGEWPTYNYATNVVSNSGALTINGVTLNQEAAGSICYCVDNYSGGSLTIVDGHVYNFFTDAIRMFCGSTTADNIVTITGGTIEGYAALWLQNSNTSANKATVNISGGNFKTTEKAVVNGTQTLLDSDTYPLYFESDSNNMQISISGGTFDIPVYFSVGEETSKIPSISITGGTFNGWIYSDGTAPFISGGTFADGEIEDYICEGYMLRDNGDDTYTVIPIPPVARIGETNYITLQEAIAAAVADDTIEILSDIVVEDADVHTVDLSSADYVYKITKNINFAGGNHTISGKFTSNCVGRAHGVHIFMTEGATVNFSNLKIGVAQGNVGTIKSGINAILSSKITIEDCEIKTSDTFGSNADWNISAVIVNASDVTIDGGTYLGGKMNGSNPDYQGINIGGASPKLTFVDGTTNGIKIESATANVAVSGGTHTDGGVFLDGAAGATVLTTGGLYANDVTAFCAPGYMAQLQTAGTMYEIVAIPPVAQIGTTTYLTLAEAVAAVPTDGTQTTITMLSDETIEGNAGINIAAGKNIILDLNGNTVRNSVTEAAASQLILNEGTLKLVGGGILTNACAEDLAGNWPGSNYVTNVISNRGTLIIDGVTVNQEAAGSICYCVDNYSGATMSMVSGTLYNFFTDAVRMFCSSTTADNVVNVSGGTIEGYGAMWMQNTNSNPNKGTLTITGGHFKTTEKGVVQGTTTLLDSSSTMQLETGYYATSSNMTVSISGGTFDVSLYLYVSSADKTSGNISITGGEFNGKFYSNRTTPFISGGRFAQNPSKYVVAGKIANFDGSMYEVVTANGNATGNTTGLGEWK